MERSKQWISIRSGQKHQIETLVMSWVLNPKLGMSITETQIAVSKVLTKKTRSLPSSLFKNGLREKLTRFDIHSDIHVNDLNDKEDMEWVWI